MYIAPLTDLYGVYIWGGRHLMPVPVSWSYVAPIFVLVAALMVPPEVLNHTQLTLLFMPIILGCLIHAWFAMQSIDPVSLDVLLWTTNLIAFNDVRKVYKLMPLEKQLTRDETNSSGKMTQNANGNAKNPEKQPPPSQLLDQQYPADLKERLYWVLNLCTSTRMHRWKIGSVSHDAAMDALGPPPTRKRFVFDRVKEMSFQVLLLSVIVRVVRDDPFLKQGYLFLSDSDNPPPSIVISFINQLPRSFTRMLCCGLWVYCGVNLIYTLPAPVAVISNWLTGSPSDASSPHTQPPHFGSFTKGVCDMGLRGVWGIWWHQQMRILASAPGRALARACRLPAGSKLRYAMQLFSAFICSGIVHAGLVPPFPLHATSPPNHLRLEITLFFTLQAVGITFETLVLEPMLFTKMPATKARIYRFGWVLAYLMAVFPLLFRSYVELRWFSAWPPAFVSPKVQGFLAGDWIP